MAFQFKFNKYFLTNKTIFFYYENDYYYSIFNDIEN